MTNEPFGAPKARRRRKARTPAKPSPPRRSPPRERQRRVYVVALERPAQVLVRLAEDWDEAERLGERARANGSMVVFCEQAPKVGRVIAEWLRGKIPLGALGSS